MIRRHLNQRVYAVRTGSAVSVLFLPKAGADYLKGRSRQALRTNLTKAKALGLSAKEAESTTFRRAVADQLECGANINYLDAVLAEETTRHMRHWLGYDADGNPIGFARLLIDGDIAWLKVMVCQRERKNSIVRYKLAAEIFQSLADTGIKLIINVSALQLDEGLIYFGQRLGFETVKIEINTRSRSPRIVGQKRVREQSNCTGPEMQLGVVPYRVAAGYLNPSRPSAQTKSPRERRPTAGQR